MFTNSSSLNYKNEDTIIQPYKNRIERLRLRTRLLARRERKYRSLYRDAIDDIEYYKHKCDELKKHVEYLHP